MIRRVGKAMERVSVEEANAGDGEDAYILQLRPVAPPEADYDALANHVDLFVSLYLEASGLQLARFAPIGPLTWAIAAPSQTHDQIENLRIDIAETLFGRDDRERVLISYQVDDATPALAEPAPEAELEPTEDASDFDSAWEPAHSSAATRAAMDDTTDVFDLDLPDLEILDLDGTLSDPDDVFDVGSWVPASELSDPDVSESAREDTFDDASEETASWQEETAEAAAQVFEGPLEISELDLVEEDDLESLTEAPPRSNADIAEELALFRSEMRQIAASIPGSGANPALDQFREEMEAVARDMSHRVDGAAERIEHALDRVESAASALPEAARLADILERAEASAEVMESSIQGAVDALTSALRAMAHSGDAPNSVADTAL